MKRLKYILPVVLVLAIVLVVLHERRDTLARDVANSLLGDSGVVIVDVTMNAVSGRRVSFQRLEIELNGGTRLVLEGLEAPLAFPSLAPEYVAINRLTVVPDAGPAEPLRLTPLAQQFLALPAQFPSTAVTIAELVYPGTPDLSRLVWSTGDDFQRFNLNVDDASVLLEIDQADRESYRVNLRVSHPDIASPLQADMAIIDRSGDVQLNAYTAIDLAAWLPVARSAIRIPDDIESAEGTLFAMVQLRLDNEIGGRIGAVFNAATDGEIAIQTSIDQTTIDDGLRITGRIPLNRPAELRLDWPFTSWALRSPESIWTTDGGALDTLPFKFNDLDCNSEGLCNLEVSVGPGTVTGDSVQVDRVMINLPLTIQLASAADNNSSGVTRIEMSRDPTVFLTGVRSEQMSIGAVSTLGVGNAVAEIGASGLTVSLDRASVDISTIAIGEHRVDALALRLTDIRYENGQLNAGFGTPRNAGTWRAGDYSSRLPGTAGSVEWQGDQLRAQTTFESNADRVTGGFRVNMDLANGGGEIVTDDLRIDFGERSLREQVTGIGTNADLIAGAAIVTGRIPLGETTDAAPPISIELDGLAARYEDTVATGIKGELEATNGAEGLLVADAVITVDLLDVGLPLTDLRLSAQQPDAGTLAVDSLAFELMGGRVSAEPFRYDLAGDTFTMLLRPEAIQLPFMAQLAGFDSLEVEGALSGSIPVTMNSGQISIAGGRLDNVPPGGVIRFNAEAAQAAAGAGGLDVASQALRNFQFDSLSSEVEYNDSGDLVLKMRLAGINPDMDPNQPIILNLNVENNIPQLLRSLQAVRSIEEILEAQSARP